MNWNGKKILITGAGGFIGSHLTEALVAAGADVTAMIRYSSRSDWGNLEFLSDEMKAKLKVVSGNVEDENFVASVVEGQEIVFHLAALIGIPYSYVAPRSYVSTNIVGTLNVLEAARRYGCEKVVHTSTSETYGTAIYTPIDEQHPLQGQSPYSASKVGADKMAESYFCSFNAPVVTLRPFNTYGPRQSARAIIPTIISQALTQDTIKLGSLSPVRDLTFVKDTAAAFMAVAASDKTMGEVINAGSGKGITMGDLAEKILSLMGLEKEIRSDEERIRPGNSEVFELIAGAEKAKELADWAPGHTLDQGLLETIDFIQHNLELFKPTQYTV